MNRIKKFLKSRTGRLVQHDAVLAVGAGFTAWQAAGQSYTWAAAAAAGAVAVKVALRLVLPVPGTTDTPKVTADELSSLLVTTTDDGQLKVYVDGVPVATGGLAATP